MQKSSSRIELHAQSLNWIGHFCDPWAVAHQAPLSMGFPRQEHWSVLQLPTPGDLPNPGIKPTSLESPALAEGLFTTSTTWEDYIMHKLTKYMLISCLCYW